MKKTKVEEGSASSDPEASFENDPTKLERFYRAEAPEWLRNNVEIVKTIEHGAYNAIFVTSRNTVLRVSARTTEAFQLARGDAVLNALNRRLRPYLGPLLLNVVNRLIAVDFQSLPRQIRSHFNATATSGWFWVSEIEYLEAKGPVMSADFTVACLIWFLAVAQREMGLVHRDLHEDNILWRKLDKPSTFVFQWGGEVNLCFRGVTHVPVMIDFDFASTFATADTNKAKLHGAPVAAPFEEFMAAIDGEIPEDEFALDFFALGSYYAGLLLDMPGWRLSSMYSQGLSIVMKVPGAHKFQQGAGLYIPSMCFANGILNDELLPPFESNLIADPKLLQRAFDNLKLKNPILLRLQQLKGNQLLARLMNWKPAVRTNNDEPHQHLKLLRGVQADSNADYRLIFDDKDVSDQSESEDEFLKSCVNCKIREALFVCGRCFKAAYCGRTCFQENWHKEHKKAC
jgi:serine/threonine protein kinase